MPTKYTDIDIIMNVIMSDVSNIKILKLMNSNSVIPLIPVLDALLSCTSVLINFKTPPLLARLIANIL